MKMIELISLLFLLPCVAAGQEDGADFPDSLSVKKQSGGLITVDSSYHPDTVLHDLKSAFRNLYTSDEKEKIRTSQLNPQAISFVNDYIQKYGEQLEKLRSWGRPYFDMISDILNSHGLPSELKYLAVIESYLKTYAVSWAGAVGPWQLMPQTARRLGLKVNSYMDERTDYYKSTHAASRYLTELYDLFDDWLLVIAAYNGGPGAVNNAIRKSGSKDFWTLQPYLPAESREHVKKFIATHYIMEGAGGVTTLTRQETNELRLASVNNPGSGFLSEDELNASLTEHISGRFNSLVIAKHILFPITEFNRYNPDFDKLLSLNGHYELRLPAEKMKLFSAKKYEIINESLQLLLDRFRESLFPPDPGKTGDKKTGEQH